MSKITAAITAVNGYVPDYVLTNKELQQMVDTTEEWIESRTGIKERRILKGEGLGTSDMCVKAIEGLLKKKGDQRDGDRYDHCWYRNPRFCFPVYIQCHL